MDTDAAVALTQDRLAEEGGTMGELLGHFRNRVSPILIGDPQWDRILACAGKLPITMGALPFGFELPLHASEPRADFGVSLASGTGTAAFFRERARADGTDETAGVITRLFGRMETEDSPLREIVGRKLMLEYDIGSAGGGVSAHFRACSSGPANARFSAPVARWPMSVWSRTRCSPAWAGR